LQGIDVTLRNAAPPVLTMVESSAMPWLTQALGTGMIVGLLGGGLIAWQALAFHVPTSMVEALLPRL